MVNFINTAPLYEVWQTSVLRSDWQVTEAAPTVLNRMLYRHELDLGFISSQEYAAHPECYKILSNLSISATGPVGSVFLFADHPLTELNGKKILLSSQSQTSVSLVKIVLEEFIGVQAHYESGPVNNIDQTPQKYAAVMAIGDDALRLTNEQRFSTAHDLGEMWQKNTDLPFVFAVWAVREEFCRREPDAVVEIHHELRRCIEEGKSNLRNISAHVAPRVPMEPDKCYEYLSAMEYDLSPEKIKALELFFKHLMKRGEATESALPLKICG